MIRRIPARGVPTLALTALLAALSLSAEATPSGATRARVVERKSPLGSLGVVLHSLRVWIGTEETGGAAESWRKAGPVARPRGQSGASSGTSEAPPWGSTDEGPVADPHG
jgi:hypothetical protein